MTWKTHLLGGIQAGVIMAAATGAEPKTAMLEIGAASLGSLLPDIDHPESKISKSDILLKITSEGLSKITKHRREVHTVWASFLFALIIYILLRLALFTPATGTSFLVGLALALLIDMAGGMLGLMFGIAAFLLLPQFISLNTIPLDINAISLCGIAIFAGCISHLIYDSANIQGIMWLHPFSKKRFHFMKIQTTSKGEDLFFFAMIILTLLLIAVLNPFGTQNIVGIFRSVSAFRLQ